MKEKTPGISATLNIITKSSLLTVEGLEFRRTAVLHGRIGSDADGDGGRDADEAVRVLTEGPDARRKAGEASFTGPPAKDLQTQPPFFRLSHRVPI